MTTERSKLYGIDFTTLSFSSNYAVVRNSFVELVPKNYWSIWKLIDFIVYFFFTIIVDFFRVGKCNPVPFRWPTFFLHSCAVHLPTSCIQSIDLLHLSFILSSITTMTFCCPWTVSNWTTIFHSIEIEVKYSSCD